MLESLEGYKHAPSGDKLLATGHYRLHGSSISIVSGYILQPVIYTEILGLREFLALVLEPKVCQVKKIQGADLNEGPPAHSYTYSPSN